MARAETALATRTATAPTASSDAGVEAAYQKLFAFLSHVPEDLVERVALKIYSRDERERETYSSWYLWPVTRWATPMAPDFMFPRALVEWLLDPPYDFWIGRGCERCGLNLPLRYWDGGGTVPSNFVPFPKCPACGAVTSFNAAYQTGPKVE